MQQQYKYSLNKIWQFSRLSVEYDDFHQLSQKLFVPKCLQTKLQTKRSLETSHLFKSVLIDLVKLRHQVMSHWKGYWVNSIHLIIIVSNAYRLCLCCHEGRKFSWTMTCCHHRSCRSIGYDRRRVVDDYSSSWSRTVSSLRRRGCRPIDFSVVLRTGRLSRMSKKRRGWRRWWRRGLTASITSIGYSVVWVMSMRGGNAFDGSLGGDRCRYITRRSRGNGCHHDLLFLRMMMFVMMRLMRWLNAYLLALDETVVHDYGSSRCCWRRSLVSIVTRINTQSLYTWPWNNGWNSTAQRNTSQVRLFVQPNISWRSNCYFSGKRLSSPDSSSVSKEQC